MCGIFGVVCVRDDQIDSRFLGRTVERLFRFSETRGREAAGLAVHDGDSIEVLKQAGSVSAFLRSARYRELMRAKLDGFARNGHAGPAPVLALTGHSRLVTNGFQSDESNNQPVAVSGAVGIHNGIIVNDAALWERHPELGREHTVDTEVLLKLLRRHLEDVRDPADAARRTFAELEGSASVAVLFDDAPWLLLATNTGSLFVASNAAGTFLAFASERFILQELVQERELRQRLGTCAIRQLPAREGLLVGLAALEQRPFRLEAGSAPSPGSGADGDARAAVEGAPRGPEPAARRVEVRDRSRSARDLQRCTRCILPSTYPMIEFDADGVCDYCRDFRPIRVLGEEALRRAVEPYRSADGSPDVIVAFSGGRDSTYGLHYVKRVLGMNPAGYH